VPFNNFGINFREPTIRHSALGNYEVREVDNESSKSSEDVPEYPILALKDHRERKKIVHEFEKVRRSFRLMDQAVIENN